MVIAWDLGSGNQQCDDQDSEFHRTFPFETPRTITRFTRLAKLLTCAPVSLHRTPSDASEFLNDSLYARNARLKIAVPERFCSKCFQRGSMTPGIQR